jgi:hypothetical protein
MYDEPSAEERGAEQPEADRQDHDGHIPLAPPVLTLR